MSEIDPKEDGFANSDDAASTIDLFRQQKDADVLPKEVGKINPKEERFDPM